ncbi:transposase [Psychromonas antarctica]|uniref:IS4 family transposase n=1 Tax=Psychromonas antarctica TaxID=67573 RepID=UPI001EE89859|nr:transposase [Psychromonas antarctica]MCG6202939.1 transposase [Psychromonas antarctica]
MNSATKTLNLPSLTADLLSQTNLKIDNTFSSTWKSIGFNIMLRQAKFSKRSGTPVGDITYLLMLWVWLKVDSVAMFSRDALLSFSAAKKDALYDLLNREDLDWRKLQLLTAKKVLKTNSKNKLSAFVIDDTVKTRRGKRMPGVSSHFDHLTARCVMGQQIVTLGVANDEQFVPVDNEIFISQVKEQALDYRFDDGRSIAAKRYQKSKQQTKPEMVCDMIARAIRGGIHADYFLADAWFATKHILSMTIEHSLVAIVRMKKNKMKYRLVVDGEIKLLCAKALYKAHVKGCWQTLNHVPYQSKSIVVELNLASSDKETAQWVKVKLLFVRSVNEEKQQASKHDWALFLTTDSELEDEKILEVYALRWGIEVYFKEAKQKLGFLKEQSRHYSAYIASIHLTGLRFCLLLFAKQEQGSARLSEVRNGFEESLSCLNFASKLWGLFKVLIAGALNEMVSLTTVEKGDVLNKIEQTVVDFFTQVMQMDNFTLRQEALE